MPSKPNDLAQSPEPYRVQLLGKLAIARGDTQLALPPRTDARMLLAYLMLHRQRAHSRSTLLGILWPEMPEALARRALTQALWQVRDKLSDVIQADREAVQVRPDASLWIDVAEFDTLTNAHSQLLANDPTAKPDLEKAVQLYQGDLLEGIYADWVLEERLRFQEKCYQALEKLVQLEKAAEHYQQALDLAIILATADPLRETAHREVMRLYYFLNRPNAALQQFAICQHVLKADLGLEPEQETSALAAEISQRTNRIVQRSGSRPLETPYLPMLSLPADLPIAGVEPAMVEVALVGREAERTQILQSLAGIFNGLGGLVLVEGEVGMGKSRLVKEIARDGEWRGAQIVWGYSSEQEANAPHEPLKRALAAGLSPLRIEQLSRLVDQRLWSGLAAWLPGDLPWPSTETPLEPPVEDNNELLVEALIQLLQGWAQVTPLLIILEDLHWADLQLINLLAELVPPLRNFGLLFIGTYQPEEASEEPAGRDRLQNLAHLNPQLHLKLQSLDFNTTEELIRLALVTGNLAEDLPAQIYQETEGNPLFVLETLRTLYQNGSLYKSEGNGKWRIGSAQGDGVELPLPATVHRIIIRQLRQLTSRSRQLLNTAAVLGYYFELALVLEVSGLTPPEALVALRELVQRRLLTETPQDYRFRYGKVRQLVYQQLSPAERLWLHGRVAQTYELMRPDRLEMLAEHFAKAEIWDQAIYYNRKAAERASQARNYLSALEYYNKAIALTGSASPNAPEQFELLAAREEIHELLGWRQDQRADLEAMGELAHANPARLVEVGWRQARLLAHQGNFDGAESTARSAMLQAQDLGNMALMQAQLTLGEVVLARGDPERALPELQAAADLLPTGTASPLALEASWILSICHRQLGHYALAGTLAEQAFAAAMEQNDSAAQADIWISLGGLSFEQGNLEEAKEYCQRALDLARVLGYRQAELGSLLGLGAMLAWTGQLPTALTDFNDALAIALDMADPTSEAWARVGRAEIYLSLGNTAGATGETQAALYYSRSIGNHHLAGVSLRLLGAIARLNGELPAARSHLEHSVASLEPASGQWVWASLSTYRESIYLALDENRPRAALELLTTATALGETHAISGYLPYFMAAHGLALLQLKQPESAVQMTAQALRLADSAEGQAYRIPLAHYQCLIALDKTTEAYPVLEQAYRLLMRYLEGYPEEQQAQALDLVPEYRVIATAWKAMQPQRITVRLPRADAPPGRALRPEEWLEINWTVALLEDNNIPDKASRRQQRLLRLLREAAAQNAAPTYAQLAQALEASERTIASDMAILRQEYPDLTSVRRSAGPKRRNTQ